LLFNSLEFAVFLVFVFGLYLCLPHRGQNRMLLVASYAFYGAWDWRFLGLIALSTLIDYAAALRIAASDDARRRKLWVGVSVVSNLGVLGAFKYAGFFAQSAAELCRALELDVAPPMLSIVLPVGISFYTFQTLSYTIDVYRGVLQPTRNLLDFALFVSFFPQLVAGPIERATRLLPQIAEPRRTTSQQLGSGAWLILWGTFKKVVVADNLGAVVNAVYAPGAQPTGLEVLFATYAFAFQIYGDFSGYTDVARGVARLLGVELMLNFDLPYLATSPADFWRRWHISLSTWLRDYLYIPLGGNQRGRARTYINLLVTMLLGGLWHGAAWTFVVWGAYQGVLLVLHRALRPWLERVAPRTRAGRATWWSVRVVVTFHLVCLGWLVFRAASLQDVQRLLAALIDAPGASSAAAWLLPGLVLLAPLVVVQVAQALARDAEVVLRAPVVVRALVYVVVFYMIVLLGEDFGQPFIYFQF
jgi:D-alanyl-lipoteichoic acid acyltransferase DltB (MBOAT superfamily)